MIQFNRSNSSFGISAFEWIANIPIWIIEGFMYLVVLIADIILLVILYINPITMIKGIIRMIIFMIKIVLAFVFDIIAHIIRQTIELISLVAC